jgi:hypothetical protein
VKEKEEVKETKLSEKETEAKQKVVEGFQPDSTKFSLDSAEKARDFIDLFAIESQPLCQV